MGRMTFPEPVGLDAYGEPGSDGPRCCLTCASVHQNRIVNREGWGVRTDVENGYCHVLDCLVPFEHDPCHLWERA